MRDSARAASPGTLRSRCPAWRCAGWMGLVGASVIGSFLPTLAVGPSLVSAAEPIAERASSVLTLDECLRRALANSHRLGSAMERRRGAEAEAAAARARRWPHLVVDAGGRWVSEVNEVTLPLVPARTLQFGDHSSYEISAGLEFPLDAGRTLVNTEQARRAAVRAAGHDTAADSLALVAEVRRTYHTTLGRAAEEASALLAVQRLERHLEELDGRVAIGVASEADRLAATARLRLAEQRAITAAEQHQLSRLELGALLGEPGGAVGPADQPGTPDAPRAEIDGAEGPRPELAALAERIRAGEAGERAAAGTSRPSISLYTRVHYGDPGVRVIENEAMGWVSAGLQLRWTPWDAGERSAQVQSQAATTRALTEEAAVLREQIETAVAIARARVDAATAQADLAADQLAIEQRRLALTEQKHREGLGTETELLDAHDDLATAEIALETSRTRLRIAESELLHALGR